MVGWPHLISISLSISFANALCFSVGISGTGSRPDGVTCGGDSREEDCTMHGRNATTILRSATTCHQRSATLRTGAALWSRNGMGDASSRRAPKVTLLLDVLVPFAPTSTHRKLDLLQQKNNDEPVAKETGRLSLKEDGADSQVLELPLKAEASYYGPPEEAEDVDASRIQAECGSTGRGQHMHEERPRPLHHARAETAQRPPRGPSLMVMHEKAVPDGLLQHHGTKVKKQELQHWKHPTPLGIRAGVVFSKTHAHSFAGADAVSMMQTDTHCDYGVRRALLERERSYTGISNSDLPSDFQAGMAAAQPQMRIITLPLCYTALKLGIMASLPFGSDKIVTLVTQHESRLDVWTHRTLASMIIVAVIERTDFLCWRDTILAWDNYCRTGPLARGARLRMLCALLSLSLPLGRSQEEDSFGGSSGSEDGDRMEGELNC